MNKRMQNPFVTTYSKIPDNSYIPTEQTIEIVENSKVLGVGVET